MRSGSQLLLTKRLAEAVLVAAIYVAVGQLGFLMAIPPGNVTPVWLPSGVALAAVLLRGRSIWPGIWLGSFWVNILFEGYSLDSSTPNL